MPTRIRIRTRNPVAMSPLLSKGGVHERSKSGIRANAKHEVQTEVSNWHELLEEESLFITTHSRTDSGDDTSIKIISIILLSFTFQFLNPNSLEIRQM